MSNKKEVVALSSVFVSASMTALKFIVGIMTGSMGILSEAAHSALDLGAAGLTLFAVKAGDKPADEDHPYGHGKIESVSALIETGLLFLTSAWIIYEALHRIITKDFAVEVTWYAFAVIIISIILDFSRSRALRKVAKETNSQALEADALHFSSDILSSCVVLIGLILVSLGVNKADTYAAIGVSIFVLIAGYRLGKRTISVLIDTAPAGIAEIVKDIISNIEGVINVDKIRVRSLGSTISIEAEIGVNRCFSITKVNETINKVKEAVSEKIKGSEIIINSKPIHLEDETLVELIRTVASKHVLSVHEIMINNFNNKKLISYDLELPGNLKVLEAHEIASHLEEEITAEIGSDIELSTHIDPYNSEELESKALSDQEVFLIKKTIRKLVSDLGVIENAHNISVRQIKGKILISLHCYADAEETIEESHLAASRLKTLIREAIANVFNVVVHVEPKLNDKKTL
jgi:cation diffusion facilitator family transporter